jgi:hypothetical protein
VVVLLADQTAALAKTAIHAALVCHFDDQAVRVAAGDARYRAAARLVHRVKHTPAIQLGEVGNGLAANRAGRIIRIDQGEKVG